MLLARQRKFAGARSAKRRVAYVRSPVRPSFAKYIKVIESGGNMEDAEEIMTEENQQTVVNYLVYHEALAVFVKKRVLSIDSIDDLFAYRFFLIMNNPEIQRKELCPEAQYYHGCYWLHKKWTEYRKKKGLYIMLEGTSLEKTDEYSRFTQV